MSLQSNTIQSLKIKKVLINLRGNNLFLCDFGEDGSCLKNEKDEVVFSFKLLDGKTTLDSLKIAVKRFNESINEAFK